MVDSYFLPQHACIGNGNELCVILQQITGRKSVTWKNHILVAFLGFFSDVICCFLDVRQSNVIFFFFFFFFFFIRYVTNRHKCMLQPRKLAGFRRMMSEGWLNLKKQAAFLSIFGV